jgi:hypothetical protein
MLDQPLGGDVRQDLVGAAHALSAVEAQRER